MLKSVQDCCTSASDEILQDVIVSQSGQSFRVIVMGTVRITKEV